MPDIEEISISHKIKKDDLKCIVCYEYIYPPFYQCNSSYHFVCVECRILLTSDACPSCHTKSIILEWLHETQSINYY